MRKALGFYLGVARVEFTSAQGKATQIQAMKTSLKKKNHLVEKHRQPCLHEWTL
jgi:hypothetical protein